VRAWLTPRPIASFPARSWRRAWLGMAVMRLLSTFRNKTGAPPAQLASAPSGL
jgi:hypothetical protein